MAANNNPASYNDTTVLPDSRWAARDGSGEELVVIDTGSAGAHVRHEPSGAVYAVAWSYFAYYDLKDAV